MQHKKITQAEIDFSKTFRFITQSYEEIAVMKMRKVRDSVLSTRDYLSHLAEVFFELKKAKEKQKKLVAINSGKVPLEKSSKVSNKKLPSGKLSKNVSVLLSANTSLYGDLIKRIFDLFLK